MPGAATRKKSIMTYRIGIIGYGGMAAAMLLW